MVKKQQNGKRCKGKTKTGKPCLAAATETGLCFFHGNPNKASELGRKGGRSKRRTVPDESDPLPSLDTMKSVHEMSKRLFEESYSGERAPKDTNGLVRLLELIRDSIRFTDLEQRLAKLELGRAESSENSSPSLGETCPEKGENGNLVGPDE